MIKAEVKKHLLKKIEEIDDPKIIHEIYRLLDIDLEEDVYVTNDAQKKAIDEALNEIKEGKILTEEEAKKRTQEWFNKKR